MSDPSPLSPAALGVPEFKKLWQLSAETRLVILNDVLQELPEWLRTGLEQQLGQRSFAYMICQESRDMQKPHEPHEVMCKKIHGPLSHALWERAVSEFIPMQQDLLKLREGLDGSHSPK